MKPIFDRVAGTVKRFNVEALMFQLFAMGVLQFHRVTKVGSGLIIITREKHSIQQLNIERYKRLDIYESVLTIDESERRKYPFVDVLQISMHLLN